MEPIMHEKKEFAILLPYRKTEQGLEFFLQKRDMAAKRAAGMIGSFGGGIEPGEDQFVAVRRELLEELEYAPVHERYFCRYEFANWISHVFIEEVPEGFEHLVVVHEGEYGKFYPFADIQRHDDVTLPVKLMTRHINEYLAS